MEIFVLFYFLSAVGIYITATAAEWFLLRRRDEPMALAQPLVGNTAGLIIGSAVLYVGAIVVKAILVYLMFDLPRHFRPGEMLQAAKIFYILAGVLIVLLGIWIPVLITRLVSVKFVRGGEGLTWKYGTLMSFVSAAIPVGGFLLGILFNFIYGAAIGNPFR